jgi:hypothetical protein
MKPSISEASDLHALLVLAGVPDDEAERVARETLTQRDANP